MATGVHIRGGIAGVFKDGALVVIDGFSGIFVSTMRRAQFILRITLWHSLAVHDVMRSSKPEVVSRV